jgi:hypothetical protein
MPPGRHTSTVGRSARFPASPPGGLA